MCNVLDKVSKVLKGPRTFYRAKRRTLPNRKVSNLSNETKPQRHHSSTTETLTTPGWQKPEEIEHTEPTVVLGERQTNKLNQAPQSVATEHIGKKPILLNQEQPIKL